MGIAKPYFKFLKVSRNRLANNWVWMAVTVTESESTGLQKKRWGFFI